MWPTLLTVGSWQLSTASLTSGLAFLAAAFVFWRLGREEHYHEATLFDGFLLAFLFGVLSSRVGFIVFNFSRFSFNLWNWLNLIAFPGYQLLFGLIGSTAYIAHFAHRQRWDVYQILDFWARAVMISWLWLNVGDFLTGVNFGYQTNLWWGIVFPGVFEKRHPLQLYQLIFSAVMVKWLAKLELNYRTFPWYKAGKSSAQTGFLFVTTLMAYSFFSWLLTWLRPARLVIGDFSLDRWIYGGLFGWGSYLLMRRAQRIFFSWSKKQFLAPEV